LKTHFKITPTRSALQPVWVSLVMALCIALAAGCQKMHRSEGKVLNAEEFTLTYTDKARAGEEVAAMKLDHPFAIEQTQLARHMWNLKYQPHSLMGEINRVFTKKDVLKTKRLLAKALSKAHPQNIIGFKIDSETGTTVGTVFANKGKLYWKFEEIQGTRHNLTRNYAARYGTAWHLVPQKGQRMFVTGKMLGQKTWENWIIAEVNPAPDQSTTKNSSGSTQTKKKTLATKQDPGTTTQPPKSTLNPELEEKLRFLKNLRDQNLIGDEEYNLKRKELLDKYL